MRSLLTYTLLTLCASLSVYGASLEDSYEQMADTLADYDPRHRPVLNQSDTVEVEMTFNIVAIQEFDEVNEKFSVVGVIFMTWQDQKLVWNPYLYNGIWSQMYKPKDVWYPVVILVNPFVELEDFVEDWMSIRVFPTGHAFFAPGSVFKSTCSVDVTYYPFDTQTCQLLFAAWAYSASEVIFRSASDTIGQSYYSENGIWELGDMSIDAYVRDDTPFIKFVFKLKRKPLFLVVNVLLPIVFMSIINILVFVLPPDSGERVSYAITVLLAIAVFLTLVGDNIPKTSKPISILTFFLMIELVISTLMCVATILNLILYYKKPADSVPPWCKYVTRLLNCQFKLNIGKNKHRGESSRPGSSIKTRQNEVRPSNTRFSPSKVTVATVEEFDTNEEEEEERPRSRIVAMDTASVVTWVEVSKAVDKICIVVFLLIMAIVDGIFLSILVNNTTSP